MPKIIPEPSTEQLDTLSAGTAASRSHKKEPVLQPMRIVDTGDHSPAPTVAISAAGTINPPKKSAPAVIEDVKSPRRFKQADDSKPKKLVANAIPTAAEPPPADFNRNSALVAPRVEESLDVVYPSLIPSVEPLPVSIAWLHNPVSMSGFVSSESTFDPKNKIKGLSMLWIPKSGLMCRIENQAGVAEFLVPEASVKLVRF